MGSECLPLLVSGLLRELELLRVRLEPSAAADGPQLAVVPFLHQLESEVMRARRGQSPLALAAFVLADVDAVQHQRLLLALREHMLSCDSLGRLDTGQYILILPGAGIFKAQALVEAILCRCAPLPCSVGIASGTGHAAQSEILLQDATLALHEALHSGDAVRVHHGLRHPLSERNTLVRSDEKRFLFSGGG